MGTSIVGPLINFRGLVYSPLNEQGVVFLFSRVLEDLNLYIEEIRTAYPDCVARRYTGKGWERVYIEFEYKSKNFIHHKHDPNECDIIICWEDNLKKNDLKKLNGIEIIELKSFIIDLDNNPIKEPNKNKSTKYNLEYHFNESKVYDRVKSLFNKLDKVILAINDEIFIKYAKTAITYYSPERNFVYLTFTQNWINLEIYTNQKNVEGVTNIKYHENWGSIQVKDDKDLDVAIRAIKRSHKIIKESINKNIKTGWYAVTPPEKMSWAHQESEN
ncbi:MAG: hypothetical protein KAU01_07195 [Candidatus Cloacimonetes bacterium]|nr:hypothetical protein [Candidatus Cloacimonadota bacterium]